MEINGNLSQNLTINSGSVEDLSDYTDASESLSAPTEVLAEFLSAVMTKDYETALKYCQLILSYEPDNTTAKEFYPLILDKLEIIQRDGDCDSLSDSSDNSNATSSSSFDNDYSYNNSNKNLDSDAETTASYSSLEEDEVSERIDGIRLTSNDLTNGNANRITKIESTRENAALKDSAKAKQKTVGKQIKLNGVNANSKIKNSSLHPSPTKTIRKPERPLKLDRTQTYTMIKNKKNITKMQTHIAKSMKSNSKKS